jgi:hypothetical protein
VGLEGELLPPPPQPDANKERDASNNAQHSPRTCRFQRRIFLGTKAKPMPPAKASPPAGNHGGSEGRRSGFSLAEEVDVVTVIVVEAGDPPDGVTLAGAKEQAA